MDKASLIGVMIGLACLGIVFVEASHGHLVMFYSLEGVLMVFGGSISVVFMSMPMSRLKCVPGYLRRFMFQKATNPSEMIKMIVGIGEKARQDGILSLEPTLKTIADPFLATGLRMAIDGVDPDHIESTLRIEILAMQERHKAGKKFFDLIKLYGPGWGLVGTLVGQIGMFGNLADAEVGELGKLLAIAVCATMYGCILANAIAGPIGDKLALRSSEEILNREMIVHGILSIQSGDNPRITLDKLTAFIPNASRAQLSRAA